MTGPNLSELAIRHRSLTIYFMLIGIVAGIYAYLHLGRNEDPAFTVKVMVVQTVWPGATQDETMRQVTDRIEKKLQELPQLDYVKSYTTAGKSTVFITLREDAPKEQVKPLWLQARNKINDIRGELPQGIQGPFFNDQFGDTFGIIYAFTADGFTHRELRDYVEMARSQLLRVQDVERIETLGAQDENIYVEFSSRRLAQLGLDSSAILKTLAAQNAVSPAGIIQAPGDKVIINVSGKLLSERDIADINIAAGNRFLRLSDIASIKRGYADPPQPIFRNNGKEAIALAISMRDGGDILALEGNMHREIGRLKADLPVGIEIHQVADQPQIVHDAVDEFMDALWEAVAIVLVISFISLGLRAGAVVALAIPLVLAIVFVCMYIFGIDLQRISLGALIIALGLLVDDAMITVESMVTKLEQGWDSQRAATFAYTSTAFPMLTGTLVTVIGFVPIGFAKSDAGEYTFSLFAVVAIALIVSWFVAVLCSPFIGTLLIKSKARVHERREGRVMKLFRRFLLFSMGHAKTILCVTLLIFCASLALLPFVQQQFFPASDRPELMVTLNLRQDASLYATDDVSRRLDAVLAQDPDIEHWSSYIGRGAVRFYLPLDVQLPNDFLTETVVVTKSLEARERVRARLDGILQEQFPEVNARLAPLELGPPVGWPVQYRVSGQDPQKVREIAQQVAGILSGNPGLQKISFNWMEPGRQLRIRVDQDEARLLGLSSATVAKVINTVVTGATATQVRDDIYLINVVVRAKPDERLSPEHLRTLDIPLPNGKTVPLSTLASVEYEQEFPLIWRRDRLPTLNVQADVRGQTMSATVVDQLRGQIDALHKQLPPGYSITVGGAVEASAKSVTSVIAVIPVVIILLLTVLMVQLQNFRYLLLVLSVGPLGLIGVVIALLGMNQPMGFVALLGIVALFGMIIRNSVILIHQVEEEIRQGLSEWDAVVAATMLRFRPIMLTAAAAICGMVPIASTVFWGPMADAIMGGLAVATALTLIFLPSLYVVCFRVKKPAAPQARGTMA